MSAFIVNDSVINRIVTYLFSKDKLSGVGYHFLARELSSQGIGKYVTDLGRVDYIEDEEAMANQLGHAMLALNVDSVEQRYGFGQAEQFREEQEDFKPEIKLASLPQVYLDLSCYLYQSCEGDSDETPLYKTLTRVFDTMAHTLARQSGKIEGAQWDLVS